MPPTKAYAAQRNARTSANDPNTSTETPPLPRPSQVGYIVLRWVGSEGVLLSPPGAASYFEAHFACTCSATNRPSEAGRPSTSAWELSTKVSGRGSLPT